MDTNGNLMTFYKALEMVANGVTVTRVEWSDDRVYLVMHAGTLCIHKSDGKLYSLIVTEGDLFAEDWVVVLLDRGKLHA